MRPALLDRGAQRRARPEQMGLADELLQARGAYARGQRPLAEPGRARAASRAAATAAPRAFDVEEAVVHALSMRFSCRGRAP